MLKTIHLKVILYHPAILAKEICQLLLLPSQWIIWNKYKLSQQKRHGLIKSRMEIHKTSLSYTPMEPSFVESIDKHIQMPHNNNTNYMVPP